MRDLLPDELRQFRHSAKQDLQTLQWDCDYWYSYVVQGLRNEIQGHTRKDQRLYQRKFCNHYSRLQRFKEENAEHLI